MNCCEVLVGVTPGHYHDGNAMVRVAKYVQIIRLVMGCALLLMLAACASRMESAEGLSDIELTWFEAASALPSSVTGDATIGRITDPDRQQALGDLRDRKLPVVIYLHGCTGLSSNDRGVMKSLAKAGYAVIAPDSMARRYRPQQCASWSKSGGYNLFVFDFRQAEINFALQQMFEQPWVDWDNLFLVGVSEGALAVAHHRGPAFRARVITQWTCHGSTLVEGIDGPDDTPILSVVRKNDPWYDGKNSKQVGDCGAFFGNRPGSTSMVLDEGKSHNVMDEPEVIQAIIRFLDQNRKR